MLQSQDILRYLADAARQGDGPSVAFDTATPHWALPLSELRTGVLGLELTRAVLGSYFSVHPHLPYGEQRVPVACCVRHLVARDGTIRALLLVPALLDADGTLATAPGAAPWIPFSHLDADGTHNGTEAVCDMDAYRAHQVALEALPPADTWPDALQRAEDLFDACNLMDEDALRARATALETQHCLLRVWDRPDALRAAARTLDDLRAACEQGTALPAPLRALLDADANGADPTSDEDAPPSALPDDALLSHKLLCGVVGTREALEEGDHRVLASLARDADKGLAVLDAPKLTNAHGVALAAMANLLTEHALRGDRAPAMACVAPREVVEQLGRELSRRTRESRVALPSRWLPRIVEPQAGDADAPGSRRVLGPLATTVLLHDAATGKLQAGDALVQPVGHAADGAAARHADAWYVPKATVYYLDCASGFLGTRVRGTDEAARLLAERLRTVDQERCELVDAYAEVCRAADHLRRRDDMVAEVGRLRREHAACRERLAFWEDIARAHPLRRSLMGRTAPGQRKLVVRNALPDEPLAQGRALVEDVCTAYRSEIERIESEIDRLRGSSATLSRRVRAASPEGERCLQAIRRLAELCGLAPEQAQALEEAIDGRDVALTRLDALLDQTVRASEFWLALHVFEAHWLNACQRSAPFARSVREGGGGAWEAWAHLCPFSLIPADVAPAVLQCGSTPKKASLDLVVVLDADLMGCADGLAVVGAARRALVVGSAASLGPVQARGAVYDEMRTGELLGADAWGKLGERCLRASGGSSLYAAAVQGVGGQADALCDTHAPYGELDDLRCELLSGTRLRTHRVPANAADDLGNPLADILPALSYVLVPDSSWKQVAGSRRNRAEGRALMRWLANHAEEICAAYAGREGDDASAAGAALALVAPYAAQAELLRELVAQDERLRGLPLEVVDLRACHGRTWPVVVMCATCGPEAYKGDCTGGAHGVMNEALAAATDAFVLFCGGPWVRSTHPVATSVMRRALRVGRLFSVARRSRKGSTLAQAQLEGGGAKSKALGESKGKAKVNHTLRQKPLSLTLLLKRLSQRGDMGQAPSVAEVNRALERAGLIERTRTREGRGGWRPTAAGREAGIVPTTDRNGSPFCAYTPASEAIVASVVEAIAG